MYPRVHKWISPYRWQNLYNSLGIVGLLSAEEIEAVLQQIEPSVYYISGQVNRDGSGSLDPVLVQPGLLTPDILPGDFSVNVLDAGGNVLQQTPFSAVFEDVEGEPLETVSFSFEVPAVAGAARIQLTRSGRLLDEIVVSSNPPAVTVQQPNGGETWSGLQTVQWAASDPDGDELRFSILYTPDNGASWYPVAGDISGTSYEIDTAALPAGTNARLRVIVTDGFNTAQDDSDGVFTVPAVAPGRGPDVRIILPDAEGVLPANTPILFRGGASDVEDATIPDESFIWSYNGTPFGTGREVTISLPQGLQEVTLTVADSAGNVSQTQIRVQVATYLLNLPIVVR